MAQSYRSRFLSVMRAANIALAALFADLSAGIAADLNRAADAGGNVPRSATPALQRAAGDRVMALFVGPGRARDLAPFETLTNGRVMPLAPYMRILWPAIAAAARLPVEQSAGILRRRLPAEVLGVMSRATVDPFAAARAQVAEIEVFRPNVLANYEPPHLWVDPNGYRLSDRIWNTAQRTRQQIDLFLEQGIREGRGALQMSRDLEQFLRPDRRNLRTNAPYGTSASYDAMRLARTEITAAHGAAHGAAAAMNPFVDGQQWNLSASHPRVDICDTHASGGPAGDGVYPLGELPKYPAHPHCLCYLTNAMIADPEAVIAVVVADVRRARAELVDKIGPVKVEEFHRLLLGDRAADLPQPVIEPPAQAQRITEPDPDAIPDLAQLTYVKRLGGSTGAELYADGTGRQFVVKSGNSDEHIRSEFLADELYRALGANVPRARLVEDGGKTYKIAEYIEGKLLSDLSGRALSAARARIRRDFAADALLGSWDVIGLNADNIIVDASGAVWRIDNGGSLLFRAQGGRKELGDYLDELWTMRDPKINRSAADVFAPAKYKDVAKQLRALVRQRSAILEMIDDPDLRDIMGRRLDHAADLAAIYRSLSTDKYIDNYIDRFSYHNTWIQSAGIAATLPRRLRPVGNSKVVLEDENGKLWDDLRGAAGIYRRFVEELNRRAPGDAGRFLYDWTQQQASSSWAYTPRWVKQILAEQRPGDYYIEPPTQDDLNGIERMRRRHGDALALESVAALNALTYESLRRVDVGRRPRKNYIRLYRTESGGVMQRYGLENIGDHGLMERGAAESASILSPIRVKGGHITEQNVPIHRVFGAYYFGFTSHTIYYNENENELLTLLEGVDVEYTGRL